MITPPHASDPHIFNNKIWLLCEYIWYSQFNSQLFCYTSLSEFVQDKKKKYEPPVPTRVGKKKKKIKGPEAANKLPLGEYIKQSTVYLQSFDPKTNYFQTRKVSISSAILSAIFVQINSALTKLCQLKLGVPLIMPHFVHN